MDFNYCLIDFPKPCIYEYVIDPKYYACCVPLPNDENKININNNKKKKYGTCVLCNTRASFNYPEDKTPKLCNNHKLEGMIDQLNKKCEKCNITRPNYNYPGLSPAVRCFKCKEEGMVDITHKEKCIVCKKNRPSFNYASENIPTHCSKCKLINMIDIVKEKCIICKKKQPTFNLQGKKAAYCADCKEENMIDVKNKMCDMCNNKLPSFNLPNTSTPLRCADCKIEGMINVYKRYCQVCTNVSASFAYKISDKPTHCKNCKTDGMVYVKNSGKCNICKVKFASYNYPGKSPVRCADCKTEGMINVNRKCCQVCNSVSASFAYNNSDKPTHCGNCRLENMINVVTKRCLSEWCDKIPGNKQYKGYCLKCYINLFPHLKISKRFKIREDHVADHVKKVFPNVILKFDEIIEGTCNKRRPDVFIDCITHVIIVEVDENAHRYYDTICERNRINELYTGFADRHIVFIRFNPDKYIDNNGKKIASCFTDSKLETPCKTSKYLWKKRLDKLVECMTFHINNIPDLSEAITNVYLYYDGFNPDIS